MLRTFVSVWLPLIALNLASFSTFAQWNQTKNYPEVLLDAHFTSAQNVYVSGSVGVCKSTNSGATWTLPDQFKKAADGGLLENLWYSASIFYDVHFTDQLNGYAAGWTLVNNSQIIIRTTNGGTTWSVVYTGSTDPDDPTQGIMSIQFPSTSIGYAGSFNGRILKTTNGGQTWSVLNTSITGDIKSLQFFSTTSGIALTETAIYKTSNSGQTWSQINLPVSSVARAMFFTSASIGFVATTSDRMLKTTDGGSTWTRFPMGMSIEKIHFVDASTGFAAGSGGIYKTTDGGQLWLLQQKDNTEFRGLHAFSASLAVATTYDGDIYTTSNGGAATIPPISLTDFSPKQGLTGTFVTIQGQNLDYVHTVIIGNVPVDFSPASQSITFSVPAGITDEQPIVIKSIDQTLSSTDKFLLIKSPYINTFAPKVGIPGASITITGNNLLSTKSLLFNGVPASFSVVNNTTLTVVVPEGNVSGKIMVTTLYGSYTSFDTFTGYDSPVISSFTPTSYYRDCAITLSGSNFHFSSIVKLNGVTVTAFVKSSTEIIVYGLPPTATSGKFSVANPATVSYSDNDFIVLEGNPSPVITNFSPISGRVGQTVTLTGTNLLTTKSLQLGPAFLSFEVIDDNTIVTEIPSGAQTTMFSAMRTNGSSYPTPSKNFTVLSGIATPVLTAINPAMGVVESEVVISGTNLAAVGDVYFNGTRVSTFRRKGLSQLVTEVPFSAKTGLIKLGSTTTTTQFEVVSNYCVPQRDRSVSLRIPWMQFGNVFYLNEDVNACKSLYDETASVVEAKKGFPLVLFSRPEKCGGEPAGDDITYFVYVDWNQDQDFYDADELIYQSPQSAYYQSINIPAGAPASGIFRARIYATMFPAILGPCEYGNGHGASVDFKLSIVNDYTIDPPVFTAFHPSTTTRGEILSVEGQHLATTHRVWVGNQLADFSFNTQSGKLDITVPEGTGSGEVIVVTEGGSFRVTDKLTIIPHANIWELIPALDTVGAEIQLQMPTGSAYSVTRVYFNGVEAQFRAVGSSSIFAKVPAGATTGKVSVVNAFDEYFSKTDFTVIPAPTITSFFPTKGNMGDYIVINGSNFVAITEVTFNGKHARFKVLSPTQISAQVPYPGSHGKIRLKNKKSSSTSTEIFTVLPDNTTATFGEIPSFNYHLMFDGPCGRFDYNGDGLMDLVVGSLVDPDNTGDFTARYVSIYRNNGDGTFAPTGVRFKGNDFLFGDFNGDGRDDAFLYDGGEFNIYYNDNNGFKNPPKVIPILPLDPEWNKERPVLSAVIDFDHDGDLDVMFTGRVIACLEQNNGEFTWKYPSISYGHAGPYVFDDIDKDGDFDILCKSRDDYRLRTYINENNVFESKYLGPDVYIGHSLAVTDYNADAQPDLLTGFFSSDQDRLYLLTNKNGTFEKYAYGGDEVSPDYQSWGDFYNKGVTGFLAYSWWIPGNGYYMFNYFDLPASGTPIEKESWLTHDALVPPIDFAATRGMMPRVILDLENDGDLDMITLEYSTQEWVRLFRNYTVERTSRKNQSPTAPTDLTFQKISDTEVLLKWNMGSDDWTPARSLQYNVRMKDETTGKLKLVPLTLGTPYGNAGMSLQYYVKGMDISHTYSFSVQAIDQGYRASVYSSPRRFRLETLATPTALKATATGSRAVTLDWTHNTTIETGFMVDYRRASDPEFQQYAVLASHLRQFTLIVPECNETYVFRIQSLTNLSVSEYSNEASATTLAVPVPVIGGPDHLCTGESIVLSGPENFTEYHWNDGSTSSTYEVNTPGEYSLTVKDFYACENSNTKTIAEIPLPTPSLDVIDLELVASGGTSYEWYWNGAALPSTGSKLRPTQIGSYKVKVTLQGCSAFSDEVEVTVTGAEDAGNSGVYITPNPTNGILTVHTARQMGQLLIVNMLGVEVYTSTLSAAEESVTIDISSQSPGLYLLAIRNTHGVEVHRVVLVSKY
jgi:photosystem II stability/assembly factor-like uncharacterized protein